MRWLQYYDDENQYVFNQLLQQLFQYLLFQVLIAKMKKKNFDDDIRFKVKQRYATISEWAFKTIESERVQKSCSLLNLYQNQGPSHYIVDLQKFQIKRCIYCITHLRVLIHKSKRNQINIQYKINFGYQLILKLNIYLKYSFFDSFYQNFSQCKKKPRLAISQQSTIQQSSKIYRKLIDPNQITRSLDYSDLADSQTNATKKKVPQNQRLKKQFQVIHNRMKLILDSYKNRERVLLKYIASLQQEIMALKQTRYQTI